MNTFLLSIGIVLYRTPAEILQQTLMHLNEAVTLLAKPVQLSLLDNLETKDNLPLLHAFAEQFPALHIQVISVPNNPGYGASNNIAIFASQAPYHLVLNPDVFLAPDALKQGISYLENHPQVGLLCPAIFGEDGARHYVHRKNPTLFDLVLRSTGLPIIKKIFAKRIQSFELRDLDWEQEQTIFSPSGCCMLFRTAIVKQANGFDPDYFLYYEDSDLGRTLQQFTQLKYSPHFKVTHVWDRAAHKSFKMKWQMIQSGLRYLKKWGGIF